MLRKINVLFVFILTTLMSVSCVPIHASNQKENVEVSYETALEIVIQQLEAQDGMRFLPLYEASLKEELKSNNDSEPWNYQSYHYNSARKISSKSTYLPNGGSVYYANYLGYGAQVSEIYLNKTDSSKYMARTLKPNVFGLVIGQIPFVGNVYSILNYASSSQLSKTFVRATNGKGTLKIMSSSDNDGEATVISYWSKSPYVTVYSNGKVHKK